MKIWKLLQAASYAFSIIIKVMIKYPIILWVHQNCYVQALSVSKYLLEVVKESMTWQGERKNIILKIAVLSTRKAELERITMI